MVRRSRSDDHMMWGYLALATMSHTLTHTFVNTQLALVPILQGELGLSIELVSLMVTIPTLAQALLYVPSGILSDRFRPDRLVSLSLLLAALGGLVITQSQTSLMLVFGFCIIGGCLAIYHPSAYSIISELFESRRRNVALGIHGAGGTLGMAVGPISVGLVMYFLGQSNWRMTYLLWAFPALGCLLVVTILKPKSKEGLAVRDSSSGIAQELSSFRSVFALPYLAFLVLVGVQNFGVQAVSTYMTTYLKEVQGLPVDYASILFGGISLMGLIAAPIGGILADKMGERSVLIVAYLGQAVSLACITLSSNLILLVPFVFAYGFTEYLSMAPMSALVVRFTPRGRRGIGYATYFLSSTFAAVVAPLAGALVISGWGVRYVFPMSICVFIAAAAMLGLIIKK